MPGQLDERANEVECTHSRFTQGHGLSQAKSNIPHRRKSLLPSLPPTITPSHYHPSHYHYLLPSKRERPINASDRTSLAAENRSQTSVENCIGDLLTKFFQNHIPPILLKRPDVRCPSILKKAMFSCAHVAHSRKIPINPSAC